MNTIKDIIPNIIQSLSQGGQAPADMGEWWRRHYGQDKRTAVSCFKDGVLIVHVDSAARRIKFEMEKEECLKHAKGNFSQIENIIFRVGRIT